VKKLSSTSLIAVAAVAAVACTSLTGCSEDESTPTGHAAVEHAVVGMFRYVGESALFRACGADDEKPVATEGDSGKLERAYVAAAKTPAEALLVRFEGSLIWQPKTDADGMIGDGKEQAWYVERFMALEPDAGCPAAD